MKIVIDARESGTTTGRYIDKLVENLQVIDKSNSYLVLYKKSRFHQIQLNSSNFEKKIADYKEFTISEQLGFCLFLYRQKADLVHFPAAQHPVLYLKKHIISLLDLTTLRFYNPAKNKLLFKIKQLVYWCVNLIATRSSKHVITISDYVKNDIIKTFKANKQKFTTTYNSADLITDKPEPVKELVGKKFIMYVGRHTPHKNLPRLVQAHQKLLREHPELILAIAGKKDKTTDKLLDSFEEKPKNIVFTGFVSEGQLRWMYVNTECYVFPSMSEGFGLPGLEAMKHGAPVASSKATCLPEIYGDAAVYFSPFSVFEMTDVINDVLIKKKLRTELIAKGRRQANKYSWKRMAEQTKAIYESVSKN